VCLHSLPLAGSSLEDHNRIRPKVNSVEERTSARIGMLRRLMDYVRGGMSQVG